MKKSLTLAAFVCSLAFAVVATVVPPTEQGSPPSDIASGIRSARAQTADPADRPDPGERADADGIRPRSRPVTLERLPEAIEVDDSHGHTEAAGTGIVIDLPERPQMVILDEVETGSEYAVRSRNDGVWSEWVTVVATEDEAPDGVPGGEGDRPDGVTGIGPIWLGVGADQVEIAGVSGDRTLVAETLEVLDTPAADDGPQNIRAAAAANPFIRARSQWATSGMGWASSNSGCGSGPKTATVTGMVVHHTAGANGYAAADVPGIMRGIWYFHVQSRGWCDVAYNFFVDRFGGVWEGRQGGAAKAIIGGHTFGFNTYTSGVAQLGNYDTTGAPSAMTSATARLVGWKLSLHGVDPGGKTTYVNSASTTAGDGTPPGGKKTLSSVVGHRDLGSTSCPGSSTYAQLPNIRRTAETGAHVRALYRAFIGSQPNADAYDKWTKVALARGLLATADELSKSAAYAGVVIDELYQVVLGRRPDTTGRNYWLSKLRSGMTVAEMSVYFYGSQEYYRGTGGRGRFVDALYRDLLHRSPEASGRSYWIAQLDRGASPTVLAAAFIDSIESRRDRVTRLYRRFLGRNPDSGGLAYWAGVLAGSDDLKLATHLALSDEFYRRSY